MQSMVWCVYTVVPGEVGVGLVLERYLGSSYIPLHGIPHRGHDFWLWRIRNGRAKVVMQRHNNYIQHIADYRPLGNDGEQHGTVGLSDRPQLIIGDKVLVTPYGKSVYAAPFIRQPV